MKKQAEEPKKMIAGFTTRKGPNGPKYIWPVRLYIYTSEDGQPPRMFHANTLGEWARREENARATRRCRLKQEYAEMLCAEYNAGEKTWEEICEQFFAFRINVRVRKNHL